MMPKLWVPQKLGKKVGPTESTVIIFFGFFDIDQITSVKHADLPSLDKLKEGLNFAKEGASQPHAGM